MGQRDRVMHSDVVQVHADMFEVYSDALHEAD